MAKALPENFQSILPSETDKLYVVNSHRGLAAIYTVLCTHMHQIYLQ